MANSEVDRIISEEKRGVGRIGKGAEIARIAVNRTGNRVARLGTSVKSITDYQGSTIVRQDGWQEGSTKVIEPVSEAERKLFGYGDLPDELIRTVQAEVAYIMPDHSSEATYKTITGLTMNAVMQNPAITPGALRDSLNDLPTEGKSLGLSDVVALDGAVTIAHYLTTAHINQDHAGNNQAVIEKQISQIGK